MDPVSFVLDQWSVVQSTLLTVRNVRTEDNEATANTWMGIVEEMGRGNKKASSGCREEEACQARSYLSRPDRGDLAPASPLRETGCCGFYGPFPSATLDKILTKMSDDDCREAHETEQCLS
jgi:hypothetical protein